MALKDFHQETRKIAFSGGDAYIHGLSFDDLSRLVTEARDDLATAIDLYGAASDGGDTSTEALALMAVQHVPGLVAKVICLAADEPGAETEALVRKMPFPVLVEALMIVGDMTFAEADALKKFLSHVSRLFTGMRTTMATIPQIGPATGG